MAESIPTINQFVALIVLKDNFPENLSRLKEKGDLVIKNLGLTVVGQNHFEFTPQGITLAYILSQSHLILHTWPELKTLHVDLMTCIVFEKDKVESVIKEVFEDSFSRFEFKEVNIE